MEKQKRQRNILEVSRRSTHERFKQHAAAIEMPSSILLTSILEEWLEGPRNAKIWTTPASPQQVEDASPQSAAPVKPENPIDDDEPWTPTPIDVLMPMDD
jgi:hypothetical protein